MSRLVDRSRSRTAVLEYRETAVGRLPVGPAADAALAAAATPSKPAARPLVPLVPALAGALAACIAIAIVLWKSRST